MSLTLCNGVSEGIGNDKALLCCGSINTNSFYKYLEYYHFQSQIKENFFVSFLKPF